MPSEEFESPTKEFFYRFLKIVLIIPVLLVIIFTIWYYVAPSRISKIKE